MRIPRLLACTTAALLLAAPLDSTAQPLPPAPPSLPSYAAGLSGALGVTHIEDRGYGLSLAAGVAVSSAWGSLTLSPLDVTLAPHPDEGRYRQEVVGGQTFCRDLERDRYTDDTFCNVVPVFAISGDVMVGVPGPTGPMVTLGAGYRALSARGPYAVAAIHFDRLTRQHWYLRAKGNATFLEVSVGAFVDPRSPVRRR